MLTRARDYSYTDVSGINIDGKFLPARDKAENGQWRVLKAEDVAYLWEMAMERYWCMGLFNQLHGRPFGEDPFRRRIVRKLDKNQLYDLYDSNGTVVKEDYEFGDRYDVQNFALNAWYPDAFGVAHPIDREESYTWNYGITAKGRVLLADYLRCWFYYLSKIKRFWMEWTGDTLTGSGYTSVDNTLGFETDGSGDRHSGPVRHPDSEPYWALYVDAFGGNFWTETKVMVDSALCVDITNGVPSGWDDKIEEMTAFVELSIFADKTWRKSMDEEFQWYQEHPNQSTDMFDPVYESHEYHDVIPAECEKDSNGKWNVKPGFFDDSVAIAALTRHGCTPVQYTLSRPPQNYTAYERMALSYMVVFDIRNVVVKFKFPSDFSNLNWTWQPPQSQSA